MLTTIHCHKGITGKHIEDVIENMEAAGWDYLGCDIADGVTVHGFVLRGDYHHEVGVEVDANDIATKVYEEVIA